MSGASSTLAKIVFNNAFRFSVPVGIVLGLAILIPKLKEHYHYLMANKVKGGEKWQRSEKGTWEVKNGSHDDYRYQHAGYTSTRGDIYIWDANNYVLIGSQVDVEERRPADVIGWGLDTKTTVKKVCKGNLKKMFGGRKFGSRSEAQTFLKGEISRNKIVPLVAANRRGMINGKWYNVTNAIF